MMEISVPIKRTDVAEVLEAVISKATPAIECAKKR